MKKNIPISSDSPIKDGQHSDGCWWWLASLFMAAMLAVIAVTAVSCTEEPIAKEARPEQEEDLPATIRLEVLPDRAEQVQTRVAEKDTSTISDLHILVYNSKGELIGKSYNTKTPFKVSTRSGSNNKIYAIANTGNSKLFDGTVADTETKLKAMKTPSLTAWDGLTTASYLVMAGSKTGVTISAGNSALQGGMTVERIAAKVTLNIGVKANSGITITGCRMFSLPKQSFYVPATTDATTTWVSDSTSTAIDNSVSVEKTFFMYENRRGVNTNIKVQKDKGGSNVPDNASYVAIKGKANGYDAFWLVYLGANNTSDFNIKRNGKYTYNITLNRPGEADTRIVDEISNCYMVLPDSEVSIPVIRANESPIKLDGSIYNSMTGTYDQIQDATRWTAFLVWETSKGLVTLSETTGKGPWGCFKVKGQTTAAEPNGGNAVVAIKNAKGEILWSWHIWVTSYDGSTTFTNNNGKRDFIFMDRALGATTATTGLLSSCGLLYQWGRKDPFPSIGQQGGSWSIADGADPIRIYNAPGNLVEIIKVPVPYVIPNNLTNATRNPDTYYCYANIPYDWFVYNAFSPQNDNLWSGGNKALDKAVAKSVFDPCPIGWRVPPWLNGVPLFGGMEKGWSWNNYGQNWTGIGGYFPASGYRSNNNGGLYRVSTGGYALLGSPDGINGCNLGFDWQGTTPSASGSRAHGVSVRCCKDNL